MDNFNKFKSLDEVELDCLKSLENKDKDIKKMFLIGFGIAIAIGLIIFLIINYIYNNTNINANSKELEMISDYLFLLLIPIGFIIFLILKLKKKSKNRTYINIPYNNKTKKEVEIIINNTLKELYYKEIKYGNEIVYYAYKSYSSINLNSLKRYIKYSVKENNVEIETWFIANSKENPIDSKTYGYQHKRALTYDLKMISKLLNTNVNGEINE